MREKKRSTFSYLLEWGKPHKKMYGSSISLAIIGVLFGIIPYYGISKIVTLLFAESKDIEKYQSWLIMIIVSSCSCKQPLQ